MAEPEMDPLVRRRPSGKRRTATLTLRLTPEALAAIDALAEKDNLSRADEARSLLRAGMTARA
jgi:hypothetical protein